MIERLDLWEATYAGVKLAPGAGEAVHTFLCSCEDDIGRLATALSPEVRLHTRLEGEYPKLLMYMPEWLSARDSDARWV